MSISLLVIILKNFKFTRSIEGSLVFELFVFVFKMSHFLINVIYWYSVLFFEQISMLGEQEHRRRNAFWLQMFYSLSKINSNLKLLFKLFHTYWYIKKETDDRRWNSFMIGRYFITVNHFYHPILETLKLRVDKIIPCREYEIRSMIQRTIRSKTC